MISSSGLYRFALADIVLHEWAQLGVLNGSDGRIFGLMRLAIRVYFWARPLSELWSLWRVLLAETSWIEVLAGFPADIQIQSRLHRCLDFAIGLPSQTGLATILSGRQGYELISPSWRGSRMGSWASMTHWRTKSDRTLLTKFIPIRSSSWDLTLAGFSTQVLLGYAASQVIQPGFQVGQSRDYTQKKVSLWINFLVQAAK